MGRGKYEAPRRRRRLNPGFIVILLIALCLIATAALLLLQSCDVFGKGNTPSISHTGSTGQANTPTGTTAPPTTAPPPTEPFVESTASIGVTGDIMGHMPVINAGKTASGYDFSEIYTYIKPYYESYDYMVANLEVNLGGTKAGPYQGYPTFNSPDEMAVALKNAGVDMVLTANNHSYDIGHNSFIRTQEVLNDIGLEHLGTRLSTNDKSYIIKDINGIQVGMLCYTYETGDPSNTRKQLNGIPVTVEDTDLVSSFNYKDLDGFYGEVETALAEMKSAGAEATMLYIHWGDEYALSPNKNQKSIAQKLCELGVDVIVGGHPHVIQPFDTLTSSTGHTTYCIYSVGNAISNQRVETLSDTTRNAAYTEDGMIFQVKFQKWNDGSVEVAEINVLPTWVNKEYKKGKYVYNIIPLDTSVPVWNCYDVGTEFDTYASYKRTMSLVGQGLNACREALSLAPVPLTHEAN